MRLLVIIGLILVGGLVGGLYGALYDQLTFTISPEFFVKYRFLQSQFHDESTMSPRLGAAVIGFINTWKSGLVMGTILSLLGIINKDTRLMIKSTCIAFGITLLAAFVVGMIGWSVSPLTGQAGPDVSLNITDPNAFKTVVNMNNFSYAGSVIGMFLGFFYQFYNHSNWKRSHQVY